jgi:inositol-phosphate phosphatase/L-galactose 1-phosphate phosphatase/histidinol-phosphatase
MQGNRRLVTTQASADAACLMVEVPTAWIELACRAADAAGEVLMRHRQGGIAVEIKGDQSPVTHVDREAETAVRALIAAECPEHGIQGEEFGIDGGDREWLWLIDPLDGTKSFLHGRGTFSTLIGLAHRGRYVLGVMNFPVVGDRWVGADGHGTRHNGMLVTTRACPDLNQALGATVGPRGAMAGDDPLLAPSRNAARWQMYGLEAMAYGLIASGGLDVAVDGDLDPHDIAALEPVVRNAGGILTDLEGKPVDAWYAGRIAASGDPALHDAWLATFDGSAA